MGFTRYFRSHETNPQLMTSEEVKAGVAAINEVVSRRPDLFRVVRQTPINILINAITDKPVESFSFAPRAVEGGWVLDFSFCKTNEQQPEDQVIEEMLKTLQTAVNGKLVITSSDTDQLTYELMDACQQVAGADAYELLKYPFDEALGFAHTMLIEHGVEAPDTFLRQHDRSAGLLFDPAETKVPTWCTVHKGFRDESDAECCRSKESNASCSFMHYDDLPTS